VGIIENNKENIGREAKIKELAPKMNWQSDLEKEIEIESQKVKLAIKKL